MGSVLVAAVTLACVAAGGMVGHRLRRALPADQLDEDTRDLVKLLSRLVSTLVALVLGLLVGSTKATYDAANDALLRTGAKFVTLDGHLRLYGPGASPLRERLHRTLASGRVGAASGAGDLEALHEGIVRLDPGDDGARRAIREEALALSNDLLQARWLLVAQAGSALPTAFLVGLDAWLAVLFAGFGLLTPRKPAAIVALLVCAASIAGAVFLIVELNHPFQGLIRASADPFAGAPDLLRR
jgi:hypothetical protein